MQQRHKINGVAFVHGACKIAQILHPRGNGHPVVLVCCPLGIAQQLQDTETEDVKRQTGDVFERVDHGGDEVVEDHDLFQRLKRRNDI